MTITSQDLMKCVEIKTPGAPSVLTTAFRERPVPGPGQVVIKVMASGVNYPDVLQRQGRYNVPPGASDLPGLEVAGYVHEIGEGVDGFNAGDAVCALTPGGGYAEYCLAPVEQCLPLPENVSMTEAATLPEVYFTLWFNLAMQGNLLSARSLLVHGGSGGIGSAAIQLASSLGLDVYTTAADGPACEFCAGLGAKRAINYLEEDFVAVIRGETEGRGVDLVLDMVGGDYIQRNMECLGQKGRLVNLYYLKGSKVEVDMMPVLVKNLTLTGSLLRPQPLSVKAEIAAGLTDVVWPLFQSGKIRPVVNKIFSLDRASDAHTYIESGQHFGKIVLQADL
ncbi:Phthiocerol synthesis polyketide synthase type I PpsC [Labrenzia sp. THAF35]|uniref:NAD(P)H-quinone oxidoreductase n=1 Tax=Labrenzia sp. THAF35 TaxID=2587854 RepID=UPI001268E8C2|nr:NAD(P)H-quinone oxidoreductase [Labrenzia sp. THAF35]QFT67932.1 Phthiocerol synthesis polyketide synthase type I PpsC [Labrenzia sp. THAF35]